MTLNITYEVSLKTDSVLIDNPQVFSNNDSVQLTSKYSSSSVSNASNKRVDLLVKPSTLIQNSSSPGIAGFNSSEPEKEITLNLEELGVISIKILHIKSISSFYYKFAETESSLETVNYNQAKVLFQDYGDIVSAANYQPPNKTPKYLRIMNPSGLNPNVILVTVAIITSYQD